MLPQDDPADAPLPAPPPYRTAAWYDPRQEHLPCQCPRCRNPRQPRRRRMGWRIVLVALGGIALPLASLVVNAGMHIVKLGAFGTALVALSVASVLAHLLLAPRRPDPESLALADHYPRSTALRVALLAGAGLSCVTWGYLALLFLPLVPISLFAIVFIGLGLCGLCPFVALSIAIHQTWRGYRAMRASRGRRLAITALLGSLLLPVASVAGAAVIAAHRRARLEQHLERIALLPRHGQERMRLISALAGEEALLLELYASTTSTSQHQTIAAVYHRVTDDKIDGAALRPFLDMSERQLIRPFAFLHGRPLFDGMLDPFFGIPRLR